MRNRLLVLLTGLALVVANLAVRPVVAQPQGPQARVGTWTLTTVADWEAGGGGGLLVTNNAGGELRLAEGQASGTFISAPFQTDFPANAAGAIWQAGVLPGTQLHLELRARATPPATDPENGWSPWQPLEAGDARAVASANAGAFATPDVVALPSASQYLQVRANFTSSVARASATLEAVTITYLRTTTDTPVFATGLPRSPLLFGAATLTPRPAVIARADWTGRLVAAQPERRDPQGVIIHQVDAAVTASTSLDFVRALVTYQTDTLGWEDMSYHYLIDPEGNLFEGRLGGPSSAVGRMSGEDTVVHIALIVAHDTPPSPTAQGILVNLLAWLGEAYHFSPTGEHSLVVGDERVIRPNLAGHNEVAPTAVDPYPPVRALVPQLRTMADQSTVRARWYFAEGNVADYSQRLAFFNPTTTQTDARVTLVRPGEAPVTRIVSVPPQARADLTVNDLVQDAAALPAIVESSAPILAERSMSLNTDMDGGPGIADLSRVWYFAEGSTRDGSRTYLILFNPNPTTVQASVTYMRRDGVNFAQTVQIAGQARLVIAVNDITQPDGSVPLAAADFGVQVIASQPLAVERTMRFGPKLAGLHTGRGITTLGRAWHFAEGTTEGDFHYRLLVLNPNGHPVSTEATFLRPDGQTEVRRYAVPPRSQLAIDVNEIVPGMGVSAIVTADSPIAVERSLTFNGGAAGTVGAGAQAPSLRWAFVDGRTSDATYYLCVSNPGELKARVSVKFSFGGGGIGTQSFDVPAGARYTLAVHEFYPNEASVAAMVQSSQPIIAERSVYPGGGRRGGATTLGIALP